MQAAGLHTFDEHRSSVVRLAGTALATFAALLPFQAIAAWSIAEALRFPLCDWAIIAGFPWLALAVVRARHAVFSSRIVRGWSAFAFAGTVSAVVNARGALEIARVWSPVMVVASLVAVAALDRDAVRRITGAAVSGGWVALSVGLAGYACSAAGLLPRIRGDLPFTFQGAHPLFDGVLRFAGTFGVSCQSMGDYLLVWLALASGSRHRVLALIVGGLAVVMTFASTWVGLPLVLLAAAGRFKPPLARPALIATLALSAAASWLINFGFPIPPSDPRGPCAELDIYHYVTKFEDAQHEQCEQIIEDAPYPSRKGTYRHAKEVAWSAFQHSPLFGIGSGAFRDAASADLRRRFGRSSATFYTSPHSDIFGTLAERGFFGAVALAVFVIAIWRTRGDENQSDARWAAAIALILVGLNADLLHQRFVWFLSATLAASPDPR